MTELDLSLRLKADGSGLVGTVRIAKTEIDKLAGGLDQSGHSADRASKQYDEAERSTARLSKSMSVAKRAVVSFAAGFAGAFSVRELVRTADEFDLLNSRLKLVSRSNDEYLRSQQQLFRIAQNTRTQLAGTVDLYSRLARSTKELNISQEDLFSVTETVNQSLVISGASAQSASASLFQLGQGLAAGALRGEELNSVMEQTPRLSEAIADGLGVTIAELRALGAAGDLSAQKVIQALISQSRVVETEFARVPRTVGQAFTQLNNAFVQYIGQANQANGATRLLSQGIGFLSENFAAFANSIVTLATAAAAALTTRLVVSLGSVVTSAKAAAGAMALFTRSLAIFGGPIGLIIAATAGLTSFVSRSGEASEAAKTQKTAIDSLNESLEHLKQLSGLNPLQQSREIAVTEIQTLEQRIAGLRSELRQVEIRNIERTAAGQSIDVTLVNPLKGQITEAVAQRDALILKLKELISEEAKLNNVTKESQKDIEVRIQKEQQLLGTLLPAKAAQQQYNEELKLLNTLKPQLTLTEYNTALSRLKDRYDDLIDPNQALIDSLKQEVELSRLSASQQEIEAEQRKLTTEATADQRQEVKALIKSRQQANNLATDNQLIKQLQEELKLTKLGNKERAIEIKLRLLSADATEEQKNQVRELAGALHDADESQRQLKDNAEPVAKIYKDTATSIRQSFRDAFRRFLDDGIDGFKGLASQIKSTFKDLLADLAVLAAKPIIIKMVASTAGLLGVQQSATASVLKQLGGGTPGFNPLALADGVGSGAGFINVPGLGPLSIQSLQTAGLASGAGFLGNSVGGLISDKLLGLRTNTAGTFGGALGGLGGFVLGGPFGAALGAAAGNIIGNTLGDLAGFGSSKVNIQLTSAIDRLEAEQAQFNKLRETPFGFVGISASSNKFGGGLGDSIIDLVAGIDQQIAALLSRTQIEQVRSGVTQGGVTAESRIKAKSFDNEIFDVAKQRLTRIIDTLAGNQVASNLLNDIARSQDNVEKLVARGQEIVGFINLFQKDSQTLNQAEQAQKALNDQYDRLIELAPKLGFTVGDVERRRRDSIIALTDDFNQTIRNQILAIEEPFTLALENQARIAKDRLDNARSLGANLADVERLAALERQQIITQQVESLKQQFGPLDDLIRDIRLSNASPQNQISALIKEFNTAATDLDVNALSTVTRELVNVAQSTFATGPQFQGLISQIEAALNAVRDSGVNGTSNSAQPITITVVTQDGKTISDNVITDLLSRSEQGEIVVDARGVA